MKGRDDDLGWLEIGLERNEWWNWTIAAVVSGLLWLSFGVNWDNCHALGSPTTKPTEFRDKKTAVLGPRRMDRAIS
jgi:hypothetical protein